MPARCRRSWFSLPLGFGHERRQPLLLSLRRKISDRQGQVHGLILTLLDQRLEFRAHLVRQIQQLCRFVFHGQSQDTHKCRIGRPGRAAWRQQNPQQASDQQDSTSDERQYARRM
jgi:hypothetical protein